MRCYLKHEIITDLRDNSIWELLAHKCYSVFPSSHKHLYFEVKQFISHKSKKWTTHSIATLLLCIRKQVITDSSTHFAPENIKPRMCHPIRVSSPHVTRAPSGSGPSHYRDLTIKIRHNILGTIPLDEWTARCRDLHLSTHNIHKRQIFMPRRDSNPNLSKRAATDTRLRTCGDWDWHQTLLFVIWN